MNDLQSPSAQPPDKHKNARDRIANIWKRARINAFAHKLRHEQLSRRAILFFTGELVSSMLSVLFVILVYIFNSSNGEASQKIAKYIGIDYGITALLCALISIVFALVSTVLSVIENVQKSSVAAAEHKALCGSYQYIAQRAREADWPDLASDLLVELLRDLERDFQLLKARGTEPSDKCFDQALKIFKKVRNDEDTKSAQSFDG
jgi:hypothetical protein